MPRKTRARIASICQKWNAILQVTEVPPDADVDELDDDQADADDTDIPNEEVAELFVSKLESYHSSALTQLIEDLLDVQAFDVVLGLIEETRNRYDGRLRASLYGDMVQLMGLKRQLDECRDILRKLQMPDRELFHYWGLLSNLTLDAKDYAGAREVMERILTSPADPEDHVAFRVKLRIEMWKLTKRPEDLEAVRGEIRAQPPLAAVRGQMSLARSLNDPDEFLKAIGMTQKLMIASNRTDVIKDIVRDIALAAHYGQLTDKAGTPREMRELVKGLTTQEVDKIMMHVTPPLRELIKRHCQSLGVEL